jgi:hypothetical protein
LENFVAERFRIILNAFKTTFSSIKILIGILVLIFGDVLTAIAFWKKLLPIFQVLFIIAPLIGVLFAIIWNLSKEIQADSYRPLRKYTLVDSKWHFSLNNDKKLLNAWLTSMKYLNVR